jgi:hypothetical protein
VTEDPCKGPAVKNVPPRAIKGPNGLVELRQMNAIQGWHSGYLTPDCARQLAAELVSIAQQMDGKP